LKLLVIIEVASYSKRVRHDRVIVPIVFEILHWCFLIVSPNVQWDDDNHYGFITVNS